MASITAKQLANAILAHMNMQLGDAEVTDVMLDAIVDCIMGAQEEMRTECPQAFKKRVPLVFTAGSTGNITIASGGKTFTLSGLSQPANGATIRIVGDSNDNEISELLDGGETRLAYPYQGVAGVQSATAYGDCCVVTDTPIDRILGQPVLASNGQPLVVLNTRSDFLNYGTWYSFGDYGARSLRTRRIRWVGVPEAIWLEPWHSSDTGQNEYRFHCVPMPNGVFPCDLDVVVSAQEVTADSFGNEATDITFGTPGNLDRTILKPFVLNQMLAMPWLRLDSEVRQSITDQYKLAIDRAEHFRVDSQAQGRLVVSVY